MADLITAANVMVAKTISGFEKDLRNVVNSYWNGANDAARTIALVQFVIEGAFTRAFRQGAAECGVRQNQYSKEMTARLQDLVSSQIPHIAGMVDSIVLKKDGGTRRAAYNRINLWIARYGEVRNEGKVMGCENRPLEWRLGAAEHCESCLKLDGIVKPASVWRDSGILPRKAGASYLRCRGYNCKCDLVRTDKELTEGPIPALP